MVTYGFYNSVDHDRIYDAAQVSELFDGLIENGVYQYVGQRLVVHAISGEQAGFQVSVGTGRAWFNHTWTKNDSLLILTLPAPPTLPSRYRCDAIILDINADISVRENRITYISGEESADSNPPHPVLLEGTHRQVPLAYIRRVGGETSITEDKINNVVGTEPCPYVAGVLQGVDITDHVAEWESAWNTWLNNKKASINTEVALFGNVITEATSDVASDKAFFRSQVTEQISEFRIWLDSVKVDFDNWFDRIWYVLDGDVAGHLQNEIDDLYGVTPVERGGTGNEYGYIRTGNDYYGSLHEAMGDYATCEGIGTEASGIAAHAEGGGLVTSTEITIGGGFSKPCTYKMVEDLREISSSYIPIPNPNVYTDRLTHTGVPFNEVPSMYFYGIAIKIVSGTVTEPDEYIYRHIWTIGRTAFGRSDYSGVLTEKPEYGNAYVDYLQLDPPMSSYLDCFYENDDFGLSVGGAFNKSHQLMRIECNGEDGSLSRYGTGTILVYPKREITKNYEIEVYFDTDIPVNFMPIKTVYSIAGNTKASGDYSHAEGYTTTANGDYSHTEGSSTEANRLCAHAEGNSTIADGFYSHAEGYGSVAVGYGSHAEGRNTLANGAYSHAEGNNSKAFGNYSHAGASGGITTLEGQFVHGNFGFGGMLYRVINQDKTINLTNDTTIFNGGLFSIENNTANTIFVGIEMAKSSNSDRYKAMWILITKDVLIRRSNATHAGIYFVRYTGDEDNKLVVTAIKESTTSGITTIDTEENHMLRFSVTSVVNDTFTNIYEAQIIRVM